MIQFSVEGDPIAQPRPQISTRGGFARAYVPAKHPIHAYRQAIQLAAKVAMAGKEPLTGPVSLCVTFAFQRPKSHSKKRREDDRHVQKPDTTNLVKGLEDALNGIAWLDDSQVCIINATKRWAQDEPWTSIVIDSL